MRELVDDLAAEHAALDAVVAGLALAEWDRPSTAKGWSVRDCVSHLAHIDAEALVAVIDPVRFAGIVARAQATDADAYLGEGLARGRALAPRGVLDWWRTGRRRLNDALRPLDPRQRLPWYARPMGARSFATARLMETWAHGLDVVDAVGRAPADTDRLRHVAEIGCRARDYAYAVHGLAPPVSPVRVELELPSGRAWRFGPQDAPDLVTGSAGDFCRVVTRRRHVDDVALDASGPSAAQWLAIAQAYAGPPGAGRRPGQFASGLP